MHSVWWCLGGHNVQVVKAILISLSKGLGRLEISPQAIFKRTLSQETHTQDLSPREGPETISGK